MSSSPATSGPANTTAGGDRNVFYHRRRATSLRSSHWRIPHVPEDALTPAHPADVLFDRIHQHVDQEKVLLASHVGGRYADIRRYF
ncbi:MAG: hypothetical protein R3E79_41400 [Caldilineaceae bacterium]